MDLQHRNTRLWNVSRAQLSAQPRFGHRKRRLKRLEHRGHRLQLLENLSGCIDPAVPVLFLSNRLGDEAKESVQSVQHAPDLKDLDRIPQVRIEDLEQLNWIRNDQAPIQPALHQTANSINAPRPLLHGRGRPANSVVNDPPAERMEVFPLLEYIG